MNWDGRQTDRHKNQYDQEFYLLTENTEQSKQC